MTATTVDRQTPYSHLERQTTCILAAGAVVPNGVLTAVTAAGTVPTAGSSDAAGLKVIGRSEGAADQTKGDKEVVVSRGVFGYAMTAGLLAVAQTMVERQVYLVDNQTVGLASDTTNKIVAGILNEVQGNTAMVAVGLNQGDVGTGEVINSSAVGGPLVVHRVVLADAAADTDVVLRDKTQVIDVLVEKTGGAAGAFANTVQVKNAAAVISDAISVNGAAQGDLKRAANITQANATINAGGTLRFSVAKAGGNAAVDVTVIGIRRA